ncbi:MAG: hypothetical protein V4550_05330 [Gemmatimonadota bacterium]
MPSWHSRTLRTRTHRICEANPVALKVLAYDRTLDGAPDRIEKQIVRIDSSGGAKTSFTAVQSAADFVRLGFVREQRGLYTFLGPDAETLLDNEFTAGYCFWVHEPDGARVNQVGLVFEPAGRRRGRVDIAGTLWVDTAARALRDIDFAFVGTGKQIGAPEPGGHIWFREMPNGVVLIDRWFLRLTCAGVDTLDRTRFRGPPLWENYLHDVGGEVARASWPDGQSWRASLGTVRLHLDDQFGRPERRQSIRLDGTDYAGTPDSAGNIVIPDLLPGPYAVVVVDAMSGVTMPTALRFSALRDSVMQFSIVAPSAERFQKKACLGDRRNTWTIGRAQRMDGKGVAGIRWDVGIDLNESSEIVFASGKTDGDGAFGFCSSLLRDRRLGVRVADNGAPQNVVIRTLEDVASSFVVTLP